VSGGQNLVDARVANGQYFMNELNDGLYRSEFWAANRDTSPLFLRAKMQFIQAIFVTVGLSLGTTTIQHENG
jgi:hypothetical protein